MTHIWSAGYQLIDQLLRSEGLTIFGKIACFVDHDAKNRLSLSILVLEKQLQTLSSLKMKATLDRRLTLITWRQTAFLPKL